MGHSVDGATVVSRELDLIGFGAKIKYDPKSDNPQIVYKIDPLEGEGAITAKTMNELGGMRHQSAANFVSEYKEAIALVVSEDGNVTAFVWNDEARHVLAFARLELTLF
jgi:DNA integrity scanning protein DisA with diadenylate cyclase activity